jgi:hypothetical protein
MVITGLALIDVVVDGLSALIWTDSCRVRRPNASFAEQGLLSFGQEFDCGFNLHAQMLIFDEKLGDKAMQPPVFRLELGESKKSGIGLSDLVPGRFGACSRAWRLTGIAGMGGIRAAIHRFLFDGSKS